VSGILFYGYHPIFPLGNKRMAGPNGLSPYHGHNDFLPVPYYPISISKPTLNMCHMVEVSMRGVLPLFCNGVKGKTKGNGHTS